MIEVAAIVGSAVVGAIVFRVRGGFGPDFWGHRQITMGAWSALLTGPLWVLAPWYYAAGALALTFGATSLPHGSGIDFGRHPDDDPDELWRHWWASPDNPEGDALFMSIRGALMTLPIGIALALVGHWPWAVVGVSGALMGACYWAGHLYAKATQGNHRLLPVGAEMGEWLTSALLAGACAALWFAV